MSAPAGAAPPAEAVVKKAKGPSLVWIVPIVAAAAAGWLWYRTIQEQGPLITISFHTADGLESGKTKVKLKYVEAGLVESISIAPDLSHVSVVVRMEKEVQQHLNEQTRFWVVRPRFGVQGISGLGTIVSGAYIEMEPGGGPPTSTFEGLETPPISPNDAPGLKLHLQSERLASMDVGTSVYFRDVCVGLVESHTLDPEGRGVLIDIYIREQFAHLVRENSCFFNASGFDLRLGTEGVELRTQALESLLLGGIAFAIPPGEEAGPPAESGATYPIYDSYDDILDLRFSETDEYVLYFDGSVRGLSVGAPVEFRGIKLGSVTDIVMQFDPASQQIYIPVHIETQRGHIQIMGDETFDRAEQMAAFVGRGLRAQLKTGNLVTGALFVDLDFHPETDVRLVGISKDVMELPTVPSTIESLEKTLGQLPEILASVQQTVDGFGELARSPQIASALGHFEDAMAHGEELMSKLDHGMDGLTNRVDETAGYTDTALQELRETLASLRNLTTDGSDVRASLVNSLDELAHSARSLRALTDYLEQHPEALLKGKELP